ncbi:MAG TPA: HDIG domain-containing protein [bacterium]|nr:HDIG domain-containing protein [bacterium]
MTTEQFEFFRAWFDDYTTGFMNESRDKTEMINLKYQHTRHVCQEIEMLCSQLNLPESDTLMAKTMALFHDVGRYEQYQRYQTFLDMKSVNHAELGIQILIQNNVLKNLNDHQQQLILSAINFHNRKQLPLDQSEKTLYFSKLLRDADKLDIWRVVIDYYYRVGDETNGAIELGLPDTPDISDGAINNLLNEKIVELEYVKNSNDFKLLQIGWVYDINFLPALKAVDQRGYLEKIFDKLPELDGLHHVRQAVRSYVNRKMTKKNQLII